MRDFLPIHNRGGLSKVLRRTQQLGGATLAGVLRSSVAGLSGYNGIESRRGETLGSNI